LIIISDRKHAVLGIPQSNSAAKGGLLQLIDSGESIIFDDRSGGASHSNDFAVPGLADEIG
jgi:hypothetical protein